ncbi:Spy/CpxP family protein refolding chaperone [Desulfomonile tiedjei]|uniref:P pilus assembly/Cpx signaling pathway, periplasmic inhibitor/zinc-resistance associated protein n=1 Tax=Desulfomonile tiedjei (strain ATCC 49306 / DSM 6799 / DCB-1) TaxID=706587 RepID=I4C613_DESTA|nr:periplasmic heavy metal sensor [Desulfomonile tiedjei]AFM25004.1 P pilus assembly/Cpx signaling pathway, periplasmic inhibitor/zinc-resistance associated protein [Desulfomonile tiedjei DSM 6799]
MVRKTILIAAMMFFAAGLMSIPAQAADTQTHSETIGASPLGKLIMGKIGRLLVLRSELNITGDQRKQIAAHLKKHANEIRPVAKDVFDKRVALRETVLNKPGDERAIMAAANDLGTAIGKAAVLASTIVADIKPVLTPEQQEHIKNFKIGSDQAVSQWIDQIGSRK